MKKDSGTSECIISMYQQIKEVTLPNQTPFTMPLHDSTPRVCHCCNILFDDFHYKTDSHIPFSMKVLHQCKYTSLQVAPLKCSCAKVQLHKRSYDHDMIMMSLDR